MKTTESGSASVDATSGTATFRQLRIWPAVLLLASMVVARWIPSFVEDGPAMIWMSSAFGPALCGIGILLWWLIFSRANALERIVGLVACIAAIAVTVALVHRTMQGPAVLILTVPSGTALFAIGAILLSRTLTFKRTIVAVLLAICGSSFSLLLKNTGMWGDFKPELSWRWEPTSEDKLVADKLHQSQVPVDEVVQSDLDSSLANPEWSEFRGPTETADKQDNCFRLIGRQLHRKNFGESPWVPLGRHSSSRVICCSRKSSVARPNRWFATMRIRDAKFGRSRSRLDSKNHSEVPAQSDADVGEQRALCFGRRRISAQTKSKEWRPSLGRRTSKRRQNVRFPCGVFRRRRSLSGR